MRRGCLFGAGGLLVLCLLLCGVGYFVGLPRFQEQVSDTIDYSISTVVAEQIPAVGGAAAPGQYVLTQQEIQDSIAANIEGNVQDLIIRIDESGITFGLIAEQGAETTYSGVPTVENGRLVMSNMKTTDGFLDFFYPADKLGNAIERAVNDYLAANNLGIQSLTLAQGELRLNTVAAS